tara:strand:- start:1119 stop:2039 length:921 start_codon:yes stop_codon:yes gene_type:complete
MKNKFAVIVSGWHFPLKFYEQVVQQKVPDGWDIEYFCVSHRDPLYAISEKLNNISQLEDSRLCDLDRILYEKIATVDDLKQLGWKYYLEPNTCGDWVVTNQWLDRYPNYRDYETLLLTHDDNFLIGDELFLDVLDNRLDTLIRNDYSVNHMSEFLDKNYGPNDYSQLPVDEWNVLSNGIVNNTGGLRGSFDFFKTSLIEKMGGKFSLDGVELDRTGETDNMDMEYYGNKKPSGGLSMKDWEKPLNKFFGFMYDNELLNTIRYLSPVYRVSNYCIEGERGLLSNMATPQSVYYNNTVNQLNLESILG